VWIEVLPVTAKGESMKTMTGSYLAATEPTGPTGTAGTEKPAPAADASKPLRTLTVKSLKMIAGSCSEAVQ